ncbi:MAG: DUF3604 domain-containing protein [Acidobacteriota bacterium]|nr:DUF3604 domain-containing protein [Acidobacteriota bacterium]
MRTIVSAAACLGLALALGCGAPEDAPPADGSSASEPSAASAPNPTRDAYFGDVHVHTRYSFDAFIFGTKADANDAYEFAKGKGIQHPAGFELKLDRPLDFQAVADHGMYLGMLPAMTDPDSGAYDHPVAEGVRSAELADERRANFVGMGPYLRGDAGTEEHFDLDIVKGAWSEIVDAAERHNDPGTFTAFIGYEYTSSGGERNNLHRNVIFRGSDAPEAPFSRLDSQNPEDLWAAMDAWRERGIDSLAIPHNSNGSGGRMFELEYYDGGAIDQAYSETRMRNEPIVENTQVKGTSDTHPALSPNDEWAEFEIMPYKVASYQLSDPPGSYVRNALRRGLAIEDGGVQNPYKVGVIGSSDTHVAAGSYNEETYWSKVGILDATAQLRGSVPGGGANASFDTAAERSDSAIRTQDGSGRTYRDTYYYTWGASGLAGVWAEENTREAIFQAFRRKETFSTSGPRIRVRFFGGGAFETADLDSDDFLTRAYAEAVPMGGELDAADVGATPSFAVWALRDALAAPLDRVQIIKGWSSDGATDERVYDVACSDGAAVDPDTHRCPDNGASVDLATCEPSGGGADELKATWSDPDFDPSLRAFYYVRVLENPTCRWSTWDALQEGVEPRRDVQATLQERAWSSPIWVNPE